MAANNQGIMHAAYIRGGMPLCQNRNAHMSTTIELFRAEPKPCKRCLAKLAKWDTGVARREVAASKL